MATFPGVHAHVGVATCDLDRAVASLRSLFGLEFPPAFDGRLAPPFGGADGLPRPGLRRATTSIGDGVRVEVLEGEPGSVWATDEVAVLHHVAYWVDDVATEAAVLLRDGWALEVTLAEGRGAPLGFAYLTKAGQARVELTTRPAG